MILIGILKENHIVYTKWVEIDDPILDSEKIVILIGKELIS